MLPSHFILFGGIIHLSCSKVLPSAQCTEQRRPHSDPRALRASMYKNPCMFTTLTSSYVQILSRNSCSDSESTFNFHVKTYTDTVLFRSRHQVAIPSSSSLQRKQQAVGHGCAGELPAGRGCEKRGRRVHLPAHDCGAAGGHAGLRAHWGGALGRVRRLLRRVACPAH